MFNDEEFHRWCDRLNLSEGARAVIEQIRSSQPARRVQSRAGNVSGRHASWKMGVILQFESRHVERWAIYEMEYDERVIEFYDQPLSFNITYKINGKNKGHRHTPDFFVLRKDSAGWEEWKPESRLIQLADKYPDRYVRTEGRWRCPPGERYAEPYGLYYRLRSDAELNSVFQRNMEMLEAYFRDPPPVAPKVREVILALITDQSGITLKELIDRADPEPSRDDIYSLMATGEIYVDLRAAWLGKPEQICLFQNKEKAQTDPLFIQSPLSSVASPLRFMDVAVGASVVLEGTSYTILYMEETVGLLGADGEAREVPYTAFEDLLKQGKLTGLATPGGTTDGEKALELYHRAGPKEFQEAQRRYHVLQPYLKGTSIHQIPVPDRTLYRWLAQYREAEAQYGIGFVGLIPGWNEQGNRRSKLDETVRTLMGEFIEKEYESLKQKRMLSVYGAFVLACESRGLKPPTYKTFVLAIHCRAGYEQIKKRQGRRAAYSHKPFYWELAIHTPRHGDRPFQMTHVDHTELDIELICSRTGRNLGRPWATLLIDAYSRRILALYLTYDPPSYRSCMMVLRECVRRFQRFPESIVVDGGREFESTYFEVLLARYECSKQTRPPAQPRFGSVLERLFGTSNTQFLYNLAGNTQITKNVRQVTKAVDPKRHALWTLGDLYELFCGWAYEHYDTRDHPALGQSPRQAFEQALEQYGRREHRRVAYDQEFFMYTLPSPPKGTAKVLPGRGVKINYIFYWSHAFRDPAAEGTQVPVRYDPFDLSRAFAYVHHRWVECVSEQAARLQNHSEKILNMATAELRQQRKEHTRQLTMHAQEIARFLAAAEKKEQWLLPLLKDQEARRLYSRPPEGGGSERVPESPKPVNLSKNEAVREAESNVPKKRPPKEFKLLEEF